MVQLTLPKNSIPVKGKTYSNVELIDDQGQHQADIRIINVYRWSGVEGEPCLLYTSPSPRDLSTSRMPSSA